MQTNFDGYKKRTNVFIGLYFLIDFIAVLFALSNLNISNTSTIFSLLVFLAQLFVILGSYNYAKWKGYSGWLALLGLLNILGLFILVIIPNKNRVAEKKGMGILKIIGTVAVVLIGMILVGSIMSFLIFSKIGPFKSLSTVYDQCSRECQIGDRVCSNNCIAINLIPWKEYSDREENFKILFPTEPSKQIKPITGSVSGQTADYISSGGYILSINDYDASATGSDLLDPSKITGLNGEILESRINKFKSYPSADNTFKLKLKNGNTRYLKSRVIVVGTSVYTLGVVSAYNSFPGFDKFANSFELLK